MSIRGRLMVTSLTTLVVGLGALLVAGNVLLAQRVAAQTSSVLRANADAQVSALTFASGHVVVRRTPNDATLDRRSWVLDGQRVVERPAGAPPAVDRAAVALGRRLRAAEIDGPDDTRLRAEPVFEPGTPRPTAAVVVALSTESLERLKEGVGLGSIVIAALVLLAGALAIRGALNGALRPVAQMTASVEDWGAHDLDRRFDLGPARDELTGLAATLDILLAQIAGSRRHEQRFASEVAHELRTPLAGLRLRAELALRADGPGADVERKDALSGIVEHVERAERAIDALLAVARQEIDPASGTVDLAAIAREFDGVTVTAPANLPVAEGDADVVRRALGPLVDNAKRHASRQVVAELSSAHGMVRLAIRDDGAGLAEGLGERAFDPGVRGPDESEDGGAGLGLALARRLARSCGGDIVIGPGPGGCFVLELPALSAEPGRD